MGEFAKVIRWTAPGATVILTAVLVVALGRWLLWQDIWPAADPHHRPLVEVDSGVVAVLVAAAVPLGFLIYQLYFYLYSRSEGVFFEFVHQDVGAEVFKKVGRSHLAQPSDWVPACRAGLFLRWPRGKRVPWTSTRTKTLWLANSQDQRLLESKNSERRPVLKSYRARLERNWRALDTELNTADVTDTRACDRVFASLARLADIYHTLGATKLSLMFGGRPGPPGCWHRPSLTLSRTRPVGRSCYSQLPSLFSG